MRGPQSHHRRLEFELELVSAINPLTGQSSHIDRQHFRLHQTSGFETLVRLVKEVEEPQDIKLRLLMHVYSREFNDEDSIFFGTARAVIHLYVTDSY